MLTRRAWLLLPLPAVLVGCSFRGEMRVSGPATSPLIKLWFDGYFGHQKIPVELLVVQELVAFQPNGQRLWAIHSTPEQSCRATIGDVRYGVTPPLYRQEAPAVALHEGVTYEVFTITCGYATGALFEIRNGEAFTLSETEARAARDRVAQPPPPSPSDKPQPH